MSKTIELTINLNDDLGITAAIITYNDTGLSSDSKLIQTVASTLLRSLSLNKEDVTIGDLLNGLDINKKSK